MKFELTVIGGGGDCAAELQAFERHVGAALEALDLGHSVHRFELCLELSNRLLRQTWYVALRRYCIYRPRLRSLLAVAQIDARTLETDLRASLAAALVDAARRAQETKGLPRDFQARLFVRMVGLVARDWARSARLAASQ